MAIVSFSTNAAIITVDNTPNSPGQYTDLQAAIDESASGDTILIHGSGTSYGTVTIGKKLTLIGEGALPDQQMPMETIIDDINLRNFLETSDNASESAFIGLKINRMYFLSGQGAGILSGIYIYRNIISFMIIPADSRGGASVYATQNILSRIDGSTGTSEVHRKFTNSVFTNNIIIQQGFGTYSNSGSGNNQLSNNIFVYNTAGPAHVGSSGDTFTNNIFYYDRGSYSGDIVWTGGNSTFTNNLFYSTGLTEANDDFSRINGYPNDNLFGLDPMFVSIDYSGPSIDQYTYLFPADGPFINYHLQESSPGKNYGTDGKDIGIYGGPNPWTDGSGHTQNPRLRYYTMPGTVPFVISMDILNSTVGQNGTLNIQFNTHTQE